MTDPRAMPKFGAEKNPFRKAESGKAERGNGRDNQITGPQDDKTTGPRDHGTTGLERRNGPLTPALSPSKGERGNRRQPFCEGGFKSRMDSKPSRGEANAAGSQMVANPAGTNGA